MDALAFMVQQRNGDEGRVVLEQLRADERMKNVRMVRVDDDGFGVQGHAAAVRFEPQTLTLSPMAALAVDGRVDVAGKVASFAAIQPSGNSVEIAVFVRFKAVMENFDGPFKRVFGGAVFVDAVQRRQAAFRQARRRELHPRCLPRQRRAPVKSRAVVSMET